MSVLDLLDDPWEYMQWQQQVGVDEAHRQIEEACRELIERDGPRAILPIGEKLELLTERLDYASAVLGEWTV